MDKTAFWSTVAQIIPVLMIALLLEWRFLARDVSEKQLEEFRSSRAVRLFQAAWYMVVCASMFIAFYLAVAMLGAGGKTEDWQVVVAVLSLGLGTGTVILAPALSLATVLVGDVLTEWHRRTPWSKVQRLARRYNALRDVVFETTRAARSVRLQGWNETANRYVMLGRRIRLEPPAAPAEIDRLYGALADRRFRLIKNRERNEKVEKDVVTTSDPVFANASSVEEYEVSAMIKAIARLGRQTT